MKMSMREFFEPFREELLKQGIEQGIEQGKVQGAIMTMLDFDIPDEVIIDKVAAKFGLSKEQVKAELDKLLVRA